MPDPPDSDLVGLRRAQAMCLAILGCVLASNLVGAARVPISVRASDSPAGDRVGELEQRIDPNVAPWWELAQLPRIGEITAKRIVAYRQSIGPIAFRSAEDLDPVERIGPATLQNIEPFLKFPILPPTP